MSNIKVMASAAFREAYLELLPEFERTSGHRVTNTWVPSVQMMNRLKGGETTDMVILSDAALAELIQAGVVAERFSLAKSGIGIAVRSGAAHPDISCAEAVKRAVLAAQSVVYSTGPSGIYLRALFEKMGIADQIEGKVRQVQGEPAGAVVARGEAEIGFQQMSELLPVAGIEIVGPLPHEIQEITVFSAGLHARAEEPTAARALIALLKAPAAAPVIRKNGMEPV